MIVENEAGKTPFKRVLLKNGSGRCVQITAWRDLKDMLARIEQVNLVLYFKALLATYPKQPVYNSGNINLEFLVKRNTEVDIWGVYVNPQDQDLLPKSIRIQEIPQYIGRRIGEFFL